MVGKVWAEIFYKNCVKNDLSLPFVIFCIIFRLENLFFENLTCFIVGGIELGDFLSYRLLLVELWLGYFTQMDFSDGCAQVLCEHSRSQKSFLEIAACFFLGGICLPELF